MRSSVIPALVLLAAGAGCDSAQVPPPPPPMPQVSGTLVVAGLTAPVTVIRDTWGVPHIEARNRDDLFFAQGYVQAQDRLFQMDLWRRSSLGRLAEVLGSNFIERDAMTRRMQYQGSLEEEWTHYGPDARAIVTAFVRGINARVVEAQAAVPEAFVLAGWTPELWHPEDLLTRTDAFVASRGIREEVLRAGLIAELGLPVADALFPPDDGRPTVVPAQLDLSVVSPVAGEAVRRVGTPPFFATFGASAVAPAPGSDPSAAGSNAWVVAGRLSESGAPLLAADPHRLLAHPSLRYVVHLQAPGWNVAGATAPWLPGVVIGHNERIAWSFTARPADTQDLFVERTNPGNPLQVLDGTRWVDMTTRRVSVASKGRDPLEYDEHYTPRGVVIAVDRARHLAYVVRWRGHESGGASELAALAINQADSWETFLEAAARWRMPAVEFVYADVEGRIGQVTASHEPVRRGWNGNVPAPGWTGRQRWQESAPPTAHADPGIGFIASANGNQARTSRIERSLVHSAPRHSVESFGVLQQDALSPDAEALVPLLRDLDLGAGQLGETARQRLLGWDRRMSPDAPEAALFVDWRERLFRRLAASRVPSHLVTEFLAVARGSLLPALVTPTSSWFDADVRASRDVLLREALVETVAASGTMSPGARPFGQVLFAHPLALDAATRERFNAGPFSISGSADAVQSLSGPDPSRMTGPSLRLIFDLADWDRARATHAPGQSELPDSPHFRDLADSWAAGDYFPLVFSDAAVRTAAMDTLTLTPR